MIPSRNRWPLLRTAIAGALGQAGVDVHVIVVDDGSTDQTAGELAGQQDARLTVLRHEQPLGVSAARNRGLGYVTAPWVAFLDDDDVWAPGHLEAMLQAVRAARFDPGRIGLVFSGDLIVDRDRHVIGVTGAAPAAAVRDGLRRQNHVGCPSRVLVRTDAARAVGGFDESLSIVADWDLWLRIVAEQEVVRCPELLVGYMRHDGNMHCDPERMLDELAALQVKHGWEPAAPGDLFSDALPHYIASIYRARGRRIQAARWYVRAFRAQATRRDLARAVSMLVGERLTELSGLRKRDAVDPALGRWLERVREAERATTSGLPPLFEERRDRQLAPSWPTRPSTSS